MSKNFNIKTNPIGNRKDKSIEMQWKSNWIGGVFTDKPLDILTGFEKGWGLPTVPRNVLQNNRLTLWGGKPIGKT